MAKLIDLQQTQLSNGRPVLRYSTTIVNVGAGAFEVHGARTSPSEMSQTQRISDSTGTSRDVVTPGTMVFGGDGHNHWHVNNLATSELFALNGNRVGTSNKRGFCFWDNIKYRLTLLGRAAECLLPGRQAAERSTAARCRWVSRSVGVMSTPRPCPFVNTRPG